MFSAKDLLSSSTARRFTAPFSALRQLLLATAVALTLAVSMYVVARVISGDLVVNGRGGQTPVPLGAVAVATLAGGVAAWAIVRIAGRTRRPRVNFLVLVVVGFAASAAAPVAAATTATSATWLLLLHVVVAVPRSSPPVGAWSGAQRDTRQKGRPGPADLRPGRPGPLRRLGWPAAPGDLLRRWRRHRRHRLTVTACGTPSATTSELVSGGCPVTHTVGPLVADRDQHGRRPEATVAVVAVAMTYCSRSGTERLRHSQPCPG